MLILTMSLLLATAGNIDFWSTFVRAAGGLTPAHLPLLAGTFVIVVLFFNALLTLASFRFVAKPVLIAILLTASCASYFIHEYGIVIDKAMVQNVFETDVREAGELLNWRLVLSVTVFGVLPSLFVARARIQFPQGLRGVVRRSGIAAGSLALAALLLVLFFKSLAPALREHRELRYLLTPTNYIQALHGYLRNKWSTPVAIAPLGRDAAKGHAWTGQTRKTVTVIVVGETARAQNFSLNGYGRDTNPMLARESGLINFANVQSCGTATAVSVPCVFSALGRERYDGDTSEFEKCSRESIVNAYDNTILYTDTFLARTIDLLRSLDGVDTSMLYFSDHGESLGEGNMYLHGAPYLFAPGEQTHVPMMLWMSDRFSERFGIDRTCLAARRQQPLSHDNVFHSVLGMLDVDTAVLNPKLDLFHACVRGS